MRNADTVKTVAAFRISRLFHLAEEKIKEEDIESAMLSKRYLRIAMEISRHYKVSMPVKIRERICKKCGSLLTAGINCKIRVSGGFIVYRCECGNVSRRKYKEVTSRP